MGLACKIFPFDGFSDKNFTPHFRFSMNETIIFLALP
jgi:hypothetical protein